VKSNSGANPRRASQDLGDRPSTPPTWTRSPLTARSPMSRPSPGC